MGKIIIKLSNNIALNKYNVEKTSQFICDSSNSYLIYGGTSELWTDMAEWLIFRGARKIVVSSDYKPQQTHINRRLSLLQTYFNAEIITAPGKALTREGASELLSEVYKLGPVHAVIVLPQKGTTARLSDTKPIHFIDVALRTTAPKATLVNFVHSAAGICQLRSEAGFITYNVQWDKSLEFVDALSRLDDILSYKLNNIFAKDDKVGDVDQESSQALFKSMKFIVAIVI